MVLIIDILRLTTNEGGIEQENEANFRPAAWGVGRKNSGQGNVVGQPDLLAAKE